MNSHSIRAVATVAVTLSLLSACGTSPPLAPRTAAQSAYEYRLGPGDELNIVVWRNPELSGPVPIRPDGKISAALMEDLPAIGKTPSQLARDLEEGLKKYVNNPSVTVTVLKFVGGVNDQVKVIGQAVKPAALPYRQRMTLLDVMIAVGGITDFAAGNRATLIRGAENNKQYRVRLHDLLKGGDASANVDILPGDVIMIPDSWF
ncbi:MAG: XrtA/PEP-CTERM system exopolysaccharide export protein [Burkholderiaceae bacterium]